jgi:hypothetical protein
MKKLLPLLALLVSTSAFAAPQASVKVGPVLTHSLVKYLSQLTQSDNSYYGGMHQGTETYAAELECSNSKGDENVNTMNCYVRSLVAFSRQPNKTPVKVPAVLGNQLKDLLSQTEAFGYLVTNGFQVLGAQLRCDDNSAAGDGTTPIPDECTLDSVF